MRDTWSAIVSNQTIRSLTVRSLPPNITTTWCKPEWAIFIQIWGSWNSAGFPTIAMAGYRDFLSRHLKLLFLDHAANLLSLDFVCTEYGDDSLVFGTKFAFGSANMPRLRSLRLENCFLDAALIDFLQSHASTLETISLINFIAITETQQSLTWAALFDGIASGKPDALRKLIVRTKKVPIEELDPFNDLFDENGLETVRAIKQKLTEDEAYPLFYYTLDEKYGFVGVEGRTFLDNYTLGEDMAAYNRLMGIVSANKISI
ncbi:hypothetical protein DFJ73DRAFT_851444 [Zopfochytrium polystomum]|nr:hypothetical protein DFJ73DRAFT_851444 [Zopfochytrium polystomum]